MFEVSTDYLLKDELQQEPVPAEDGPEESPVQDVRSVLCPVPVLLDIWSQKHQFGVNEDLALGPAILLVMVAIGVVVLILCGMQISKYDYMEKERIRLK